MLLLLESEKQHWHKLQEERLSISLLLMYIQEMLLTNSAKKRSLKPNLSIGYLNWNSSMKTNLKLTWLNIRIWDILGKKIKLETKLSSELSIGLDFTLMNMLEMLWDLLLHLLQIVVTLPWLKLWILIWEELLQDLPVPERPKQQKILVVLLVFLSSCSTVLIKWQKIQWLKFSWDWPNPELGDVSMNLTEFQSKCYQSFQPKSNPYKML